MTAIARFTTTLTPLTLIDQARALICATPKGDAPAPKGAPELPPVGKTGKKSRKAITKLAKIPVPGPKPEQQAASAARDLDDVPDFLDRTAGKTKEEIDQKRVELIAKSIKLREVKLDKTEGKLVVPTTPEATTLAEEVKAKKLTKAQVRIEKLKAQQNGATKAMPLTGKAALVAIAAEAVTNGTVKVTKVPAGQRAADVAKPKGKAKAKPGKVAKAEPAKRTNEPRKSNSSKLDLIVALLKRKSGCTTADILEATGWPTVTVPGQARTAGLKLRKEKIGKVTRYWGS